MNSLGLPHHLDVQRQVQIKLGDKGMTIKVSMKIPPRFVGYQRLVTELDQSKVVQDRDTIVSAQ